MLYRSDVEAMAVPVTEAVLVATHPAVDEPTPVYALVNDKNTKNEVE